MLPLELGLLNQAQRWRLKTADAVIYRALLPYVTTSHSHTLDANHLLCILNTALVWHLFRSFPRFSENFMTIVRIFLNYFVKLLLLVQPTLGLAFMV